MGAVPRAAAVPGVGRRRAAPGDALHRTRRHLPPQQLARRLVSVSGRHGVDVEHDPVYGCARAWLSPRGTARPMAEELFATAPARVIDKQDANFEPQWHALTSSPTAQLPLN
ncbi:hypothetical protein AB0D47_36345 [Streptomyces sp. NPDC048376]|uniref:hypothetical protein n=1 Tax=Streptomyces sp. NPDC048376 TaxID=3154926 RepID=UPI00343B1537